MAWTSNWLDRCAWARRSREFGDLTVLRDDIVCMGFAGPGSGTLVTERLWELWRTLPTHPNLLTALEPGLLAYAALDWQSDPLAVPAERAELRYATWGVVLVRVIELLAATVPAHHRAWFASPIVKFDLEGMIRLAFVSTGKDRELIERLPPEVLEQWPHCDDRALVYVIGQLLSMLTAAHRTSVDPVVARCLERDPARRFQTLDDLRGALHVVGGKQVPRRTSRLPVVWQILERGIGYLVADRPQKALAEFARAHVMEPRSQRTNVCVDEAMRIDALSAQVIDPPEAEAATGVTQPVRQPRPWLEVHAEGLAREAQRDFDGALALYVQDTSEFAFTQREIAIARCELHRGRFARAIAMSERALDRSPDSLEAHAINIGALLQAHRYGEALARTDAWLALTPDDARALHARGKSLTGLARFVEAREAFERAITVNPQLVEAMLLRREVDRALKSVRDTVGVALPMTDVPAHLAEVRDALVGGRVSDGIQLLSRVDYERDGIAQLLLGELLAADGRHNEALRVFERASALGGEHRASLGKARELVELRRAGEALDVLDHIGERADVAEAIELRAQALRQLGRDAEAEAADKRYMAVTNRRSELRVRGR